MFGGFQESFLEPAAGVLLEFKTTTSGEYPGDSWLKSVAGVGAERSREGSSFGEISFAYSSFCQISQ